MKLKPLNSLCAVALFAAVFAGSAQAQVRITEVAPWSSGNSPVGADWFEVTNFGATTQSLAGWKMDDSSFSSSVAVALNGGISLAAGESAIFVDGTSTTATAFVTNWFGGTAPAGFKIGTYTGPGVGLGTGGDGVILFNASNVEQARVSFGTSPAASPFATFDNSAGLNAVTLATLSSVGLNGAFQVVGGVTEIGSPGVTAVPEPGVYAMMLAGLMMAGGIARRRRSA